MKVYFDKEFQLHELMQHAAPCIIQVGNRLSVDLHSTNILNFMMLTPINETEERIFDFELKSLEYDPTESAELLEFRDLVELDEKSFEKFKIVNIIARHVKRQKSSGEPRFLNVENSLVGVEVVLSVDKGFLISHPELFSHKGFVFLLDCIIASMLGQLMKGEPVRILSNEPLLYRLDLQNITAEKAEALEKRFSEFNSKIVDMIDGMFVLMKGVAQKFEESILQKHRESVIPILCEGVELSSLVDELQMLENALKGMKL